MEGFERFHWINESALLSVGEIEAVAISVWGGELSD